MNDRQHVRWLILNDVCIRMQEAWGIAGIIDLRIVPHIAGGYIGRATHWHDGRNGHRVEIQTGMTLEQQIWVLAHELRHIMQYQARMLVGTTWCGERVSTEGMRYNDLPWERDANAWADAHAKDFC